MDKVVEEKQLPIKMAAFGHCFRTEAGAGGTAGKGLYRVHQFSKVEMFVLCTPEQATALLEELIAIEVGLMSPDLLRFVTHFCCVLVFRGSCRVHLWPGSSKEGTAAKKY